MCSSTAAATNDLPYTARSHNGAREGVKGVPPSVRPTNTKLDHDQGFPLRANMRVRDALFRRKRKKGRKTLMRIGPLGRTCSKPKLHVV